MSWFEYGVFGFFFFSCLTLTVVESYRRIRLYCFGKWADARFMCLESHYVGPYVGSALFPRVRFFDETGQRYEILDNKYESKFRRPTRAFRVVYLPHQPQKGEVYNTFRFWIIPFMWLGGTLFGGVFFIGSLMGFFTG